MARAFKVDPEHFREFRIRVITEKLEKTRSSSTGCTSGWRRGEQRAAKLCPRRRGAAVSARLDVLPVIVEYGTQ